eukprot:gnl/Hemi2/23450_TR7860_c0_g8_i1.p1 gnl/Hemi2/23450_TR7860_c0_g8~~gnl/Hemi2/23450_TR7860_c0_g8_i1.p1  ORF type:complete len:445 (-),score=46.59 gnl/Hemi2/23450_TR7860_c0_g8_i1:73-1407(-)
MDNNFLNQGVQIMTQAVDEDNKQNYEEAYKLYIRGVEFLMTALKYEKNERSRDIIKQKVENYMSRAEELKDVLKRNGGKRERAVADGGAATKKGGKDEDEEDPEKSKLKGALESAIVREKPNVKWDDVAGLESAKDALREAVILPIKFPHIFTGKRKPWRAILLFGPPGTGKSYLAKAVATEANSTFFSISSSDLVSKWQGESERLVKQLFELARENKPSIVFIDEIDSLCSARSDSESESARRIKTEILVQTQGVGNNNDGVLILGATNIPWGLDSAVRRRFDRRIYISLPELPARMRLFQLEIGQTPHSLTDADFTELARRTEGWSGSDIAVAVKDALMEPVRTLQNATHFKQTSGLDPSNSGKDPNNPRAVMHDLWQPCSPGDPQAVMMSANDIQDGSKLLLPPISLPDFIKVLSRCRPTVSPEDLRKQIEFTEQFGQGGD